MNFLDWIKKYSVAISFLFGVLTGALTMYFGFQSRLDTIDFKLDMLRDEAKREYENIYDVLHRHRMHIDKNNKQKE